MSYRYDRPTGPPAAPVGGICPLCCRLAESCECPQCVTCQQRGCLAHHSAFLLARRVKRLMECVRILEEEQERRMAGRQMDLAG